MKRAEGFTADDGTWFATRAECRRYEEIDKLVGSLVGLSEELIRQALKRGDAAIELADTLERAGKIIGDERRASGELRRLSKKPDASVAFDDVAKAMAEKVKN